MAVLPNPVAGPVWLGVEEGALGRAGPRYAILPPGRKTVLFLGRLHPVKGLERLLGAWGRLGPFHASWQLVLAGPDEGGYRAVVEQWIESLGCGSSVRLVGALDEAGKWEVLRGADLFVMPSDFENFGLAIAEALLAETPVITTTGTPWQALADSGAGWWVEPSVPALSVALAEAMATPPEQLRLMGRRGLAIAQSFAPDRVANQLVGLYHWLRRQDERPGFVRMD